MITKSPIFITGCARSGSSMIAAIIHECGAFGGELAVRHGLFENAGIRNMLVKPYLRRLEADAEGQYPLIKLDSLMQDPQWKDNVEYILSNEGYKGGPWMYKDSRLSLMWPIWDMAFPDAKWVIVRRRTGDVIQSCKKTGFMKAFKNEHNQRVVGAKNEEEGWLWFIHEYEKRLQALVNSGVDYRIIWPERMVNEDYSQLHEIIDWLGLTWKDSALDYIKLLLWGNKQKKGVSDGSKNQL